VESYDVIVVSYFLERKLAPALIRALQPGGLLFYQTHIRDKVDDSGPANEAFLLARNELLSLFSDLTVLVYREEGRVGDIRRGFRNRAMLVGMKQ
jgi:tellurite methyltransferase